jgi:DNA-binding CsgD family transcriptional regulator
VTYAPTVIVGRDAELARIDALIAAARGGEGGALVLRGEAGIGKTALLEAAWERAGEMRVFSARGVQAESELPFACLSDVLDPLLERLSDVPEPQAAALRGALGLGPPAPGDRFAVSAATLGVLRASAEREPLLAVVDDAHWVDAASLECLLFAARRGPGGVAMLLAARAGDPDPLAGHGLAEIDLEPLDAESSRLLLLAAAPDLAPPVADALAAAAAGNPLALLELPATLHPAQRRGESSLERPLAPGKSLARVYRSRLERLPEQTREALVVAATAESEQIAPVLVACRGLGLAAADLEPAEDNGLVRLTADRLSFSHPLVRGAVLGAATPARRRRAHRALAEVLDGERRAWHLAGAALGPDEEAAGALEQAGAVAAGRRAYASASAAFERAAALSAEPARRAGRLFAASQTAAFAGRITQALTLLEEAAGLEVGPAPRARVQGFRGVLLLWAGRAGPAIELLLGEADRTAERDPIAAAVMLADAALAATSTGDCRRALEIARRGAALLGDGGDPQVRAQVLATLGWALALRGEVPAARPVFEEVDRLLPEVDPISPAAQAILASLNSRIPFEEYEQGRAACLALVAAGREAGALSAIPYPLVVAAEAGIRLGEWDAAEGEVEEAERLALETGHGPALMFAVAFRARLAAARGREQESRDCVARAVAVAEQVGAGAVIVIAQAACGFLELGLGRVDRAIAELEETARLVEACGLAEPSLVPWRPDLVEAYVMAGRVDDAHVIAHALAEEAERTGGTWGRAAAARCRGLLARSHFDVRFEQALALHEQRPMPFERARTLLAYGSRLHRARRRVEARDRLRQAKAIFDELGAAPWSARAEAELRAAGAVRRRPRSPDVLSRQELRVAAAVARGATNREVAAELFLSPKTVEFHLGRIYSKLGVRSRTQLAGLLASGALEGAVETGEPSIPA